MHDQEDEEKEEAMRQIFKSMIAGAASTLALAYIARWSRSRVMDRKVHELQEKFRGLDK